VITTIGVVPNSMMSTPLLLGRDALKLFEYRLIKDPNFDKIVNEIFNIDYNQSMYLIILILFLLFFTATGAKDIFREYYHKSSEPELSKIQMEVL